MADWRENKEKKLQYYHLHRGRAKELFSQGPKILSIRKCAKLILVYIEKEAFVKMTFNVIRSNCEVSDGDFELPADHVLASASRQNTRVAISGGQRTALEHSAR